MLVHITWQPSGDEATPPAELDVPDKVANDDVAGYLEEQHHASVTGWKPLARRADPGTMQPLKCPYCDSDTFTENGYVGYCTDGAMWVSSAGVDFSSAGHISFGDDYRPITVECTECGTPLQTVTRDPFERPDPDMLRVRLAGERQQLAEEEQQHPSRAALDYENDAGTMANLEELGPVEAYNAGIEAGIEFATGAALRAICGSCAYVARNDWRLRLLNYAKTVLNEHGARLITLSAGGRVAVASRLYPETAYTTARRMMDVAWTRQTRVQNETDANVYVARRFPSAVGYPNPVAIYTGRHCLLVHTADTTPAAATP